MKWVNQSRNQIIGILCLLLFLFTAPLSRTFLHAHTLPDGQILVHAHLFPGSNGQDSTSPDHSHTHNSLLFHHVSSGDVDLAIPVFNPDLSPHHSSTIFKVFTTIPGLLQTVLSHGNRAPPL